jgi:hypothetical protein
MGAKTAALAAVTIGLLTPLSTAFAQDFSFTRIVDPATPRPDGQGNFNPAHTVSTDGQYVVWGNSFSYLSSSIWSADLGTLALTKLADFDTPVPGGAGNFACFDQTAGGIYSGFNVIVRSGTVVFIGCDAAGDGLYSVPAAGGDITRIVNSGVKLPNGGVLGPRPNPISAFGLNDLGTVVFAGYEDGYASDGVYLGTSVFTAAIDGSNLTTVADENHLFNDPVPLAGCVDWDNTAISIAGDHDTGDVIVFSGEGNHWQGFYLGSAMTGAPPTIVPHPNCKDADLGTLVSGSNDPLPGDPYMGPNQPQPAYFFTQTDGQNIYFIGSDFYLLPCCNSQSGNWGGIFSIPVAGGAVTKIVADGDILPGIGQVTDLQQGFSVDNGGVVFLAANGIDGTSGMFLWQDGQISKVFTTGDSIGGSTVLSQSVSIWPQGYKNGVIAFNFNGAVFVATPAGALSPSSPPPHRR